MPIRQTLLATFQAHMASFDSAMRSTAMLAMSGHELRSEYLFPKCQKKTKKKILPSVWPVSTPVELTFERVKGSLGHATNFYSKTPSPIIKPQQRKKLRRSSYMGGSMTLPIIFAFTASRKPRSYSVDLKGDNQEDYNLRGFE